MKLKQICYYHLYEFCKAVLIFYGVVCALVVFPALFFTTNLESTRFGGMEPSAIIFLFIAGLNSFKGQFRFMMANCVSRKSQFWGFLVSVPITAGAMAVVDTLLAQAFSLFVNYDSFFYLLYSERYSQPMVGVFQIERLLWSLCLYSAVMMLGYLITVLYYRMNRMQKILVSVLVPVTLIAILPYIDVRYTDGKIFRFIANTFVAALGLAPGVVNPYIPMVVSMLGSIALASLSWLLMRRAVVKD